MTDEKIEALCNELRSRIKAIKSDSYEIDVFVKDNSFLLFTVATPQFSQEFTDKLP